MYESLRHIRHEGPADFPAPPQTKDSCHEHFENQSIKQIFSQSRSDLEFQPKTSNIFPPKDFNFTESENKQSLIDKDNEDELFCTAKSLQEKLRGGAKKPKLTLPSQTGFPINSFTTSPFFSKYKTAFEAAASSAQKPVHWKKVSVKQFEKSEDKKEKALNKSLLEQSLNKDKTSQKAEFPEVINSYRNKKGEILEKVGSDKVNKVEQKNCSAIVKYTPNTFLQKSINSSDISAAKKSLVTSSFPASNNCSNQPIDCSIQALDFSTADRNVDNKPLDLVIESKQVVKQEAINQGAHKLPHQGQTFSPKDKYIIETHNNKLSESLEETYVQAHSNTSVNIDKDGDISIKKNFTNHSDRRKNVTECQSNKYNHLSSYCYDSNTEHEKTKHLESTQYRDGDIYQRSSEITIDLVTNPTIANSTLNRPEGQPLNPPPSLYCSDNFSEIQSRSIAHKQA